MKYQPKTLNELFDFFIGFCGSCQHKHKCELLKQIDIPKQWHLEGQHPFCENYQFLDGNQQHSVKPPVNIQAKNTSNIQGNQNTVIQK